MDIQMEQLTPEEVELIKQHREEKKKLVLTHIKEEDDYRKEFDEIQFFIQDAATIRLSTKYQTDLEGKHHSASGFFDTDLTPEDAEKIRDFMNLFLQQTNANK